MHAFLILIVYTTSALVLAESIAVHSSGAVNKLDQPHVELHDARSRRTQVTQKAEAARPSECIYTCFELPNFSSSTLPKMIVRSMQLCSKLKRRSACTQLVDEAELQDDGKTVCVCNLHKEVSLLKSNKPLHADMVPKLSVRPTEWNTKMSEDLAHGSSTQGHLIEYHMQFAYQFSDAERLRRMRNLPVYKHVQKLSVSKDLAQVNANYVQQAIAASAADHASSKIVLDLRVEPANHCDDENGGDCEYVVVGEAMPTWLFIVLALLMAGLLIFVVVVLLWQPTDVLDTNHRAVHFVHSHH